MGRSVSVSISPFHQSPFSIVVEIKTSIPGSGDGYLQTRMELRELTAKQECATA